MASMTGFSEEDVGRILSQMNSGTGQQQQFHQFAYETPSQLHYNETPAQPSTSTLPPLPPLPMPLPGLSQSNGRKTRQAKAAAITNFQQQDEDGENSGDYEDDADDLDDFQAEDDIIYDFPGSITLDGGDNNGSIGNSGSMSPNGTKSNGRPKGKKTKGSTGPGVPKDSTEYTKLRKENHKNVEKKRRETINDGIKRLSNLVPGADKNKSKIINQAAEYIAALKDNEASNIEKWTLDKLMTEKTIRELQGDAERLRNEVDAKDKQIADLQRRLLGR